MKPCYTGSLEITENKLLKCQHEERTNLPKRPDGAPKDRTEPRRTGRNPGGPEGDTHNLRNQGPGKPTVGDHGGGVTIAHGGVLPNINPVLLPKKTAAKESETPKSPKKTVTKSPKKTAK